MGAKFKIHDGDTVNIVVLGYVLILKLKLTNLCTTELKQIAAQLHKGVN